jgi:hypothetical protein
VHKWLTGGASENKVHKRVSARVAITVLLKGVAYVVLKGVVDSPYK